MGETGDAWLCMFSWLPNDSDDDEDDDDEDDADEDDDVSIDGALAFAFRLDWGCANWTLLVVVAGGSGGGGDAEFDDADEDDEGIEDAELRWYGTVAMAPPPVPVPW